MKIYTRTGDRGETGLFGGGRVAKDDTRVEAYGQVDELNAVLGTVASALSQDDGSQPLLEMAARVRLLQADLFTIGANLATPGAVEGGRGSEHIPPLPRDRIGEMEGWIDAGEAELEPLRVFILPGGTEAAARLHLARTVCRRAERRVITLAALEPVEEDVIVYLNRLSDLLFTWARLANLHGGGRDLPWNPNERG